MMTSLVHTLSLHLQPKMSYKDGYQKSYFVLESFKDAEAKLRALGQSLQKPMSQ